MAGLTLLGGCSIWFAPGELYVCGNFRGNLDLAVAGESVTYPNAGDSLIVTGAFAGDVSIAGLEATSDGDSDGFVAVLTLP